MGMIPEAHKVSSERRDVRDTLRARLHLVEKHVSVFNSLHRVLEKFNAASIDELPELFRLQAELHVERADLIKEQIRTLDRTLNERLLDTDDIQRLMWIPGIGRINAFTIYLEVDGIERFASVKNFNSYCRLVPGARNSAGKSRQHASKEGNRYLKLAFSHAATRAIQYFPVVKRYYERTARKKGRSIARTLVAKEIAKSVYFVLSTGEPYNRIFKGIKLEHSKLAVWPHRSSPDA
jgi:transposase